MVRLFSVALCAALLQSASAFVAAPSAMRASTSLNMKSADDEKRFAASFLTAAYLFANVVSVAPAFAMGSDDFAGSTQVVAAKSGGRMGGRSAVGSRGSTASYARPTTTNVQRTTVQHTTIIAPPVIAAPVYVAPPVYGGYGYGIDAGTVGLTVGLSAINSIGREIREESQEREIYRERQELAEARLKQAELEGRLRALEAAPVR